MKYYGTVGPTCMTYKTLKGLMKAGMTGLRINLSHTNLWDSEEVIGYYKQLCERYEQPLDLLIDLEGPELRINTIEPSIVLKKGQNVAFVISDYSNGDYIPVNQATWALFQRGDQVILDDGQLMVLINEVNEKVVSASVIRGGELSSRKSMAIINRKNQGPTLTARDLDNIGVAGQYGVTGVMLPFVRGGFDLLELKKALVHAEATKMRIYAKIENQEGLSKIEEIISQSDEVVIARGDLGNSMPIYELPVVQDYIGRKCLEKGGQFMIVTQLLESMRTKGVPTRAEVNDIYQAVMQGATSLMLTGETADGEYPIDAMTILVKTAQLAIEQRNSRKNSPK